MQKRRSIDFPAGRVNDSVCTKWWSGGVGIRATQPRDGRKWASSGRGGVARGIGGRGNPVKVPYATSAVMKDR